jgi:hypothetical protein
MEDGDNALADGTPAASTAVLADARFARLLTDVFWTAAAFFKFGVFFFRVMFFKSGNVFF